MIPEGRYKVTGVMSGTSLDGLDVAACVFEFRNSKWNYTIEHAQTFPFSAEWKNRLRSLMKTGARELAAADAEFGKLAAEFLNTFHRQTGFDPLFIASHGHTVFHEPASGFTTQIGSGAAIAAFTGKPVVCDFRSMDVCLGGQGAPLVPAGDQLLFHQFDACLNLGGFSNISFNRAGKRIAFDICPVNFVLNRLAVENKKDYDKDGNLAAQGQVVPDLLENLNKLPYFTQIPPKSLGAEWTEKYISPILAESQEPANNKLRTFVEHICVQINQTVETYRIENILLSGGGVYNRFLINRLQQLTNAQLEIPDKKTIEFKEALIFALLGLLRWQGEPNCLSSATGAKYDNIGGAVYLPAK